MRALRGTGRGERLLRRVGLRALLARRSECPVAPRHRLEELEDFLADSDDITLTALKELAMEHTRRELLRKTRQ